MIAVRPATEDDARDLAPRLRAADAAEAWALGIEPAAGLIGSIERAVWAETYMIDGEVAAIAGLGTASLVLGPGVPWLMTAEIVEHHRKELLRRSREQVGRMLSTYPELVNFVHAEHVRAIRWLKWLGFRLDDPMPLGPHRALFHRFTMGMA